MLTKIKYNNVVPSNGLIANIDVDNISGLSMNGSGVFLANSKIIDRGSNRNNLVEYGSVVESPVATGSELMSYSGFSATNYLGQPYNSVLDFGTGGFHIMGWYNTAQSASSEFLLAKGLAFDLYKSSVNILIFRINQIDMLISSINFNTYINFIVTRINGNLSLYINGKIVDSNYNISNVNNIDDLIIGNLNNTLSPMTNGKLTLLRIGAGAPNATQILEIYESERHLFQENTTCTLSSSKNEVNALDYDSDTELLHIAGADNLDTFKDLIRVTSEVGAYTSISARNKIIAKGN